MCRSTGSLVPVGLLEWHGSCAGPSCCTTPSRSLARLTRVPSTSVFALLVVQCLGARMRVAERASLCAWLRGALGVRSVHISLLCHLLPALMRGSCLLTPAGIDAHSSTMNSSVSPRGHKHNTTEHNTTWQCYAAAQAYERS